MNYSFLSINIVNHTQFRTINKFKLRFKFLRNALRNYAFLKRSVFCVYRDLLYFPLMP